MLEKATTDGLGLEEDEEELKEEVPNDIEDLQR